MKKIKSFYLNNFLSIVKCCLIGIVATLLGTVLFAVVLKFADLSSTIIKCVSNVIKVFAIFILVVCIRNKCGDKLLIRSLLGGLLYAILTFIIFSILNGSFVLNAGFWFDLLYCVISSMAISVIVSLLNRKSS